MAGEPQILEGPFALCQAAQSISNGGFNTNAPSAISAVLSAPHQRAPMLGFRIDITGGTPTENGVFEVHRIRSDGTNEAPSPSAYTGATSVGYVIVDNAQGSYFIDDVDNTSVHDKFVLKNVSGGASITAALYVAGFGLEPGA